MEAGVVRACVCVSCVYTCVPSSRLLPRAERVGAAASGGSTTAVGVARAYTELPMGNKGQASKLIRALKICHKRLNKFETMPHYVVQLVLHFRLELAHLR